MQHNCVPHDPRWDQMCHQAKAKALCCLQMFLHPRALPVPLCHRRRLGWQCGSRDCHLQIFSASWPQFPSSSHPMVVLITQELFLEPVHRMEKCVNCWTITSSFRSKHTHPKDLKVVQEMLHATAFSELIFETCFRITIKKKQGMFCSDLLWWLHQNQRIKESSKNQIKNPSSIKACCFCEEFTHHAEQFAERWASSLSKSI